MLKYDLNCNEKEYALYEELLAFMEDKEKTESSLISILHKAQNLFGYISKDAMEIISKELGLPVSKIYGVVTFYSYFTLKPKGKYSFSVCLGTACYVKGANDVLAALEDELGIKSGDTTADFLFSIIPTRCLGDCSRAPIVMVNDELYGYMDAKKVRDLVKQYRKGEMEK